MLWKEAGRSSELNYTEQTSWWLFLKYLDDLVAERTMQTELVGVEFGVGPSCVLGSPVGWA